MRDGRLTACHMASRSDVQHLVARGQATCNRKRARPRERIKEECGSLCNLKMQNGQGGGETVMKDEGCRNAKIIRGPIQLFFHFHLERFPEKTRQQHQTAIDQVHLRCRPLPLYVQLYAGFSNPTDPFKPHQPSSSPPSCSLLSSNSKPPPSRAPPTPSTHATTTASVVSPPNEELVSVYQSRSPKPPFQSPSLMPRSAQRSRSTPNTAYINSSTARRSR